MAIINSLNITQNGVVTNTGGTFTGSTGTSGGVAGWGASNALTSTGALSKGDIITSAGSGPANLTVGTNGQVLTAQSGQTDGLLWATIVQSTSWTSTASTTISMVAGNGYSCTAGTLVTLTLPSTAAVGDTFEVFDNGTGLFKIAQNASQQISWEGVQTTSGTGGSLQSLVAYQSIKIVATATNTSFGVTGANGSFTIV